MNTKLAKQIAHRVKQLKKKHKIDERQATFEVLDDIYDDLPDGAYFAAMESHGYEAEDIMECSENQISRMLEENRKEKK